MAQAEGHTFGDRLERAVERHADTAREIERGEHEKPHNLRRNVVWLAVTLVATACQWDLQRVIAGQLARNALSNIAPGGGLVGFVESGLTAVLALAGVSAGEAMRATLAYRLFSYRLPLPFRLLGVPVAPRAGRSSGELIRTG